MLKNYTTITLICASLAAALVGAGCGDQTGTMNPIPEPRSDFNAGTLFDTSWSGKAYWPVYVDSYKNFAYDAGVNGSGKMAFAYITGNSVAEANVQESDLAATSNDAERANSEVMLAVAGEVDSLSTELKSLNPKDKGSGIIEGFSVIAPQLQSGDQLLALTDGVQSSEGLVGDFHQADLSSSGIEALLKTIRAKGMLPDLTGVTVHMPYIGQLAGKKTSISSAKLKQIQDFWEAFVSAGGGQLDQQQIPAPKI